MNPSEILEVFERSGALQHGHFVLSSGRHSDTYLQCALVLQHPGFAERLGHELGERLAAYRPDVVVGPAVGGIVIAHETGRHLGVRSIFAERVSGAMTLRRGFVVEPHERVVVVEDVVTTGRSPTEVIDRVRAAGAETVAVGAIVDRSSGVSFGIPFESLVTVDAGTWEAQECPLCRSGSRAESPGSRHLVR